MTNIAMITDFYYPSTGGIETHIRYISRILIELGHKVIIITHIHKNMKEHLDFKHLKIYALDLPILALNTTFPSLYANFYIYKQIFEYENIEIVHGHQTMSNMCIEGLFHACTLNLKTVLTEHSLFEKGPIENIIVNSLCSFALKSVDRFICVSETSKLNLINRLKIDKTEIVVIPNGVLSDRFYPEKLSDKSRKNIIVMSRLVYRKGVDLLVQAIPLICRSDSFIKIFIAGEGFKKDDISQVIDENNLGDRVFLLGNIEHNNVGEFLRTGSVFVNTSLTETFCMAILEAAMCGLHVVSTNIGGVHEVLPRELITFCKPTAEDLAEKVLYNLLNYDKEKTFQFYDILKEKYMWSTIVKKTECLYNNIPNVHNTLETRLKLCDNVFKQFLIVLEYIWLLIIDKISI